MLKKAYIMQIYFNVSIRKESPPATPETCSIEAILARLRQHVLNHPLVTEAFLDFDKVCFEIQKNFNRIVPFKYQLLIIMIITSAEQNRVYQ